MIAESAAALQILMNDDLYLSREDLQNSFPAKITVETELVTIEEPVQPEISFTGKNLKNILVLTDAPVLENHLKALENTLLRKQLSLDDVALVDFSANANLTYQNLHTSFMPQKLILFGLNPARINLSETVLNQIVCIDDLEILHTYSFDEMLGNKDKTKAFWEPMKNL
ncbi:MAG: hypothetical protein EOP42_04840 [Sphingobacteriaceae bacterium]|nr:MAG: hypothetical protein EOP42_04840 [Sphingobacteriaceae bacterium]